MEKNTPKQLAPVNGTPFDYLRWRGDLAFARDGFNEVDNLVLCILSYINFRRIDAVHTKDPAAAPTLAQVAPLLTDEDDQLGLSELSYLPLLRLAAQTERFRDLRLFGYTHEYDEQSAKQFDALSFLVPDGTLFVAFMGTDTSLAGWKEDFNMGFVCPVPGQKLAVDYLQKAARRLPGRLTVCGHSKGGNFAVYAAAFCGDEIQDRIEAVYNYDGPGFDSKVLSEPGYQRICQKIQTFVPQSSVVGMLLGHEEKYIIVHSEQTFLQQHDTYSWEVRQKHFHYLDTVDNSSRFVDYTLKAWLAQMTPAQREQFVDAIYEVMRQTNAHTLHQMNENWLASAASILKSAKNMDEETRQAVTHAAGLLLSSAKDGLLRVVLEQEAEKGE